MTTENKSAFPVTDKDISIPEQYQWLVNDNNDSGIDIQDLISWIVVDEKKAKIIDEHNFCDEILLQKLISIHNQINQSLPAMQYEKIKKICNPFEEISKSIFVDRNAVKLANIDSLLDNMFTNPVDIDDKSLIKSNEIFSFATLGGGSGGFIDYMLWRRGWNAKAYAFTVNEIQRLHRFTSKAHRFQTIYGVDKKAELTHTDNITSFRNDAKHFLPAGVHILLNDTAIPVGRETLIKEIISKKLNLVSCALALHWLKDNGHFIIKIFDHLTPFTVGLIYIMYKCFHKIAIVKPNSTRPANSEHYLICKWKKSNTNDIGDHLLEINETMAQLDNDVDVIELVSMDVLKEDKEFMQYITKINNALLRQHIQAKEKILEIYRKRYPPNIPNDYSLAMKLREKCLHLWNIPSSTSVSSVADNKMEQITSLMESTALKSIEEYVTEICPLFDKFNVIEHPLNGESDLQTEFSTPRLWYSISIENSSSQTFYLRCPKNMDYLYQYNQNDKQWHLFKDYKIMLPQKTLIYGELITVYGNDKYKSGYKCLQIIDCYVLDGEKFYEKSYLQRSTLCYKFVSAIGRNNGPFRDRISGHQNVPIKSQMKKSLLTFDTVMQGIKEHKKIINDKNVKVEMLGKYRYFRANGLIIVHEIDCYQNRRIWKWNDSDDDMIFEKKLLEYVKPFALEANEYRRNRDRSVTNSEGGRSNNGRNCSVDRK